MELIPTKLREADLSRWNATIFIWCLLPVGMRNPNVSREFGSRARRLVKTRSLPRAKLRWLLQSSLMDTVNPVSGVLLFTMSPSSSKSLYPGWAHVAIEALLTSCWMLCFQIQLNFQIENKLLRPPGTAASPSIILPPSDIWLPKTCMQRHRTFHLNSPWRVCQV